MLGQLTSIVKERVTEIVYIALSKPQSISNQLQSAQVSTTILIYPVAWCSGMVVRIETSQHSLLLLSLAKRPRKSRAVHYGFRQQIQALEGERRCC
jgi:hypothetical protein